MLVGLESTYGYGRTIEISEEPYLSMTPPPLVSLVVPSIPNLVVSPSDQTQDFFC